MHAQSSEEEKPAPKKATPKQGAKPAAKGKSAAKKAEEMDESDEVRTTVVSGRSTFISDAVERPRRKQSQQPSQQASPHRNLLQKDRKRRDPQKRARTFPPSFPPPSSPLRLIGRSGIGFERGSGKSEDIFAVNDDDDEDSPKRKLGGEYDAF
jgi:hypothetical protein